MRVLLFRMTMESNLLVLNKLERLLTVCKVKNIDDIDLSKEFYFIGKTDEETSTTKIKSGLSEDDYIAWADDTYKEGMKTTTEYQTETDGDANAS